MGTRFLAYDDLVLMQRHFPLVVGESRVTGLSRICDGGALHALPVARRASRAGAGGAR